MKESKLTLDECKQMIEDYEGPKATGLSLEGFEKYLTSCANDAYDPNCTENVCIFDLSMLGESQNTDGNEKGLSKYEFKIE